MSTMRHGLQQTLCLRQTARTQLLKPQWQRPNFHAGVQVGVRSLSISSRFNAELKDERETNSEVTLAPEAPFQGITRARPLPVSPSYFSREPRFNDFYIKLSSLMKQYQHLPTLPPELIPRQSWKNLEECRQMFGESVKANQYGKVIGMVKRLFSIHPNFMHGDISRALKDFKKDFATQQNMTKLRPLDKFGRALGIGRRKTSAARAWVVEGTGEVLVNGKPLNEVFGRIHDRESAVWALRSTERTDKYNVWALVDGGGVTGQAEALTLAIARAMLAHEPGLRPILRKAGCITRDARNVERKKHGYLKARKAPAWVKR